jgi:hypothetical protein
MTACLKTAKMPDNSRNQSVHGFRRIGLLRPNQLLYSTL